MLLEACSRGSRRALQLGFRCGFGAGGARRFGDSWGRVVFCAVAMQAFASVAVGQTTHTVALFPSAVDASRQGFVRVVNHSAQAGEVRIDAHADAGNREETITLSVDGFQTVHFNSDDLEQGNAAKGLSGGVGAAYGDWWLQLASGLDIEVLAYIRTADGFLTSMHDVAPSAGNRSRVAFFNPGSNLDQVSRLRLVNPGKDDASVTISGVDDLGASSGSGVKVRVPAASARSFTAEELESGGQRLEGSLGDGVGKWRLSVDSDHAIMVMNLLENPTGHLTNISTPPPGEPTPTAVPLFAAAGHFSGRQGFIRVVNRSAEAGEVSITAFDDTGRAYGPVTFAVGAGVAVHFNSDDLERGNEAKGLSGSTGPGQGDWRLELAKRARHRGTCLRSHGRWLRYGNARYRTRDRIPKPHIDLQPRQQPRPGQPAAPGQRR